MRTDISVELSKRAREVGVDGVMVTPPPYILPSEEEIFEHYRRISEEAGMPILIYNIPKRVGVGVSPELLLRLTEIDNVVAIKQSDESLEVVIETVRLCGDKIKVFAGHSVTRGFPCAVMGVDGFVSSVETQIVGKEVIGLYKLSTSGDLELARKIQHKMFALDHAVHGLGNFPSALKAAMNLRGRPGGFTRSPVQALSDNKLKQLKKMMGNLGLL
jgi:4-hydroxy-tetrahydrodipicolinate synthase